MYIPYGYIFINAFGKRIKKEVLGDSVAEVVTVIYEFDADIRKIPDADRAYVEIPVEIRSSFGRFVPRVCVQVDGVLWRGRIVQFGMPCSVLYIRREIRQKLRKGPGDWIHIAIGIQNDFAQL